MAKMVFKNTAHFCENHGKITAVYMAVNLLKLMVSNSRKIYFYIHRVSKKTVPVLFCE